MDGTVLYVRADAVGDAPRTAADEFETTTARSAAAAAETLDERRVDCVVVAERVADGSGLAAVEAVRERDDDVPVLFCSSEADGELAAAATRRGATEYYPRDAAGESLTDRVRAHLDDGASADGDGTTTDRSEGADGDDARTVAARPGDRRVANGGGAATGASGETGADRGVGVGPDVGLSADSAGLRATRDRYAAIIEAVDDGVYALDDEGQFVFVNQALADMTGYTREELLGEHTRIIKDDETVAKAERTLAALLSGEDSETAFELSLQPRDGEPVPCEDHMVVLTEDGEFAGTAGVIRDITERKRREERLSQLIDTSQALMTTQGREDVARVVADATADALGHDHSVVRLYDEDTGLLEPVARGSDDPSVTDRPTYEPGEGGPGRAFETGETLRYARDVETAAGETGGAEDAVYVPLGDRGVLTIATTDPDGFDDADVSMAEVLASTAAVALGRAAREADLQRYRTVIENVQDMVYVVDENARFSLVTDPLASWLGYDREDLLGRHPREVLAADEADRFEDSIADLWQEGDEDASRRIETEWVDDEGERHPAEVEVSLYPTDDGYAGSVGVVRDMSELVRTRERLETQRNRFSYLFDNLPDAVVEATHDDEGRPLVRDVNDAFTEVFGYEHDTVVGASLNEFILPGEVHDEGRDLDVRAADGETINREVRRRTADGFRDFLFRGIPYEQGDDGTHSFGIYTDITAQKERERRLEVLNRVLRHNLRNDLNVVLGYAELLADELDGGELGHRASALREKAAELASLSDRARSLDRTMGRGAARDSSVSLSAVVDDVTTEYAADSSLTVETAVDDERVVGDARLGIAVEELLDNVDEHVGDGATVRVETQRAGREVVLRVADDGPGIPEEERAVITGSREITQLRHGSGLGLWVAKWVCESCGGRLRFEESALGGAAVALALPPADD